MAILLAQTLLLSAKTLIPDTMLQENRINKLNHFFKPRLNTSVTIDLSEEIGRKHLAAPYLMKGYIEINPPQGYCFTIQRKENISDKTVCKKTFLSFQIKDLNQKGELEWLVKTGPNDFGTTVKWKTTYRVGRFVDYSMAWPGDSNSLIIKNCELINSKILGRLIKVDLFHGKQMTIKLPKKDKLVPQPERKKPNLYIQVNEFASDFVDIVKDGEREGRLSIEQIDARKKEEDPKDHASSKKKEDDPNTIAADWQSHPREAFSLNASSLIIDGASPNGMQGVCRYKYSGFDLDPDTGLLECHHVGKFQWLYMPLVCLKK